MKQAIAGVAPASSTEATIMVVWPSIAVYWLGRSLGTMLSVRWPNLYIFRLGVLLAPLAIPPALLLYGLRLMSGLNYRLTNRRIVVLQNQFRWLWWKFIPYFLRLVLAVETKSVQLDRFSSIEIVRRRGQLWYDAGDLIFRDGATETFRLDGVSRPEAFRQACLKAHMAYVGVKRIRERQPA